jgi:hypothetical protein
MLFKKKIYTRETRRRDVQSTAQTQTQQQKRRRKMENAAAIEVFASVGGRDGGAAGRGGTMGGEGGVGPTRMLTS